MKVAKVGAEPKTIGIADVNASVTLPQQCHLSNKLSVLCELCHARQFCSYFLQKIWWGNGPPGYACASFRV